MSTTRFITYKCNLCKRTIDEENKITTVKFTKCNITLGCEGKLYPIGSKNTRNIVATSAATEVSTEDWMPREQVAAKAAAIAPIQVVPISLITGINSELTIAVPSSMPSSSLTVVANKRRVDASVFSVFTFLRAGTVSFISGMDNSADNKTLAFENTDTIEVYVNSVKLSSSAWSKNVTTQAISFSPALVGENLQIKINVAKAVVTPSYNLTFTYNSAVVENSSWSNVRQIKLFGATYKLYTYSALSSILKIGEELQLLSVAAGATSLTSSAYLMLAYSPYSPVDRELNSVIKFSEIVSEWLIAPVSEKLNLSTVNRLEKSVWPTISATLLVNANAEQNQLAGSTETVEKANNPYLLGPT